MPNLLFYSQYCKVCADLLALLQRENLLVAFQLVCVDSNLAHYKKFIRNVPTMIISTLKTPLEGRGAFDWVARMKAMRQQHWMHLSQAAQQRNVLLWDRFKDKSKLWGYLDSELGGFSDDYAYMLTDEAMPHAHFGVGDETKHAIYTPPKMGKVSSDEQKRMIADMEAARGEQDKEHTDLAEKQQMEALMREEFRKSATPAR